MTELHPLGCRSGPIHRMWVDDLRPPPDLPKDTTYEQWGEIGGKLYPGEGCHWYWVRTSDEAIQGLAAKSIWYELSLDHDLGGDDTTRPVVLWMCENDSWPDVVKCHSANPVGREWIEGMIERYKPKVGTVLCGGCDE